MKAGKKIKVNENKAKYLITNRQNDFVRALFIKQ